MHHLQRSLDILYILKGVEGSTNAPMQAKDLILHQSCQREPVKQFIHPIKDRPLIVRIFVYFLGTFVLETKINIDLTILMISPN